MYVCVRAGLPLCVYVCVSSSNAPVARPTWSMRGRQHWVTLAASQPHRPGATAARSAVQTDTERERGLRVRTRGTGGCARGAGGGEAGGHAYGVAEDDVGARAHAAQHHTVHPKNTVSISTERERERERQRRREMKRDEERERERRTVGVRAPRAGGAPSPPSSGTF
jgi:hypothetical protein